jgi:hypothetical protein
MARAGSRRRVFHVTHRDAKGAWYVAAENADAIGGPLPSEPPAAAVAQPYAQTVPGESALDAVDPSTRAELRFGEIPHATGGGRRPRRSGRA